MGFGGYGKAAFIAADAGAVWHRVVSAGSSHDVAHRAIARMNRELAKHQSSHPAHNVNIRTTACARNSIGAVRAWTAYFLPGAVRV